MQINMKSESGIYVQFTKTEERIHVNAALRK